MDEPDTSDTPIAPATKPNLRRSAPRRGCDAQHRAMESDVRTFIAHVEDKLKEAKHHGRDARLFAPLTMRFVENMRARLMRLDEECP